MNPNIGEKSAVQTGNTCSAKRDPRQGRQIIADDGQLDEELMSSIDLLYGTLK